MKMEELMYSGHLSLFLSSPYAGPQVNYVMVSYWSWCPRDHMEPSLEGKPTSPALKMFIIT